MPADARTALEHQFDRLLAENKFALVRLAGGYTNSSSDRDDLLQNIALSIWQALPGFRGECSERTFVFRIAHNRAITYLARNRSRGQHRENQAGTSDSPSPRLSLARRQVFWNLARPYAQPYHDNSSRRHRI